MVIDVAVGPGLLLSSALVASLALMVWPAAPPVTGGVRRRDRSAHSGPGFTGLLARPGIVAVAVGTGVVVLVGVPAGLAAAALTGTVGRLVRVGLAERQERREVEELLAGLRILSRELRSGASPAAAAQAASEAARGAATRVLANLAAAMRVGLEDEISSGPDSVTATRQVAGGAAAEVSGLLRSGWQLSRRFGVPWASLIDALVEDLADRSQSASERAAQVAGPKFSGYVLSALPAFGLVLGTGMGADPFGVLLGSTVGGVLLIVGAGLTCAGLLWSAKIVAR